MKRYWEIPFTKFHGLGNDFVVVRSEGLPSSLANLARAICRRNTGVGADGLLVLAPSRERKIDAELRFFNADGSEAEMSGNGIRCAAAYLVDKELASSSIRIRTVAGVKTLQVIKKERGRWLFRVAMGRPILAPSKMPFSGAKGHKPVVGFPLRTERGILPVTVTSMGNPHCSILVREFSEFDWPKLGSEIEKMDLFPNRTNVEFVRVISRKEIEVRYWERGVGVTNSSGTGSCAATVAAILNRRTGRTVRVRTLAGSLRVSWLADGEVTLTGPAQIIAEGTYHYL
jgi:diaminopimelate epimerase